MALFTAHVTYLRVNLASSGLEYHLKDVYNYINMILIIIKYMIREEDRE